MYRDRLISKRENHLRQLGLLNFLSSMKCIHAPLQLLGGMVAASYNRVLLKVSMM
jgi:hypothetical protein